MRKHWFQTTWAINYGRKIKMIGRWQAKSVELISNCASFPAFNCLFYPFDMCNVRSILASLKLFLLCRRPILKEMQISQSMIYWCTCNFNFKPTKKRLTIIVLSSAQCNAHCTHKQRKEVDEIHIVELQLNLLVIDLLVFTENDKELYQ